MERKSTLVILTIVLMLVSIGSASLLAASPQAPAAACTWDGSTGNWSDSTRWSCGTVPGSSDEAIINSGSVTLDQEVTVQDLILSGGTLQGSNGITVTNAMAWTDGTLGGSGATTVADGAALNISATGSCWGTGARLTGRTLNAAGTATLTGTTTLCVDTGAIINNSGLFDVVSNVNVDIWAGGTRNAVLNNTGTLRKSGGVGTSAWSSVAVNNAGTVQAQSGTLRLANGGTSSGSYYAAVGATLDFGGGTHTINLTAASSISGAGTVSYSGDATTVSGDGSYAVAGTTVINGGTLSVEQEATTTNLTVSSGTLQGSNGITVTGVMTWTDGTLSGSGATTVASGAALNISATGSCWGTGARLTGRTLNVAGTATLTGTTTLCVDTGAIINNSGLFDVVSNVNVDNWSGGTRNAVLNNTGTLRKSGGAGTSAWFSVAVNNAGIVQAQSGTLRLSNGGTSSGSYYAAVGATLDFGGGTHTITLTTASSISGAGTVSYSGGATTVSGEGSYAVAGTTVINGGALSVEREATTTNLTVSSGTLQGSNGITVTNAMAWTDGTLGGSGATTVASGAALNISATGSCWGTGARLTGRTLNVAGTATLTGTTTLCVDTGAIINNSGLFDVVSNVNVDNWSGGTRNAVLNNTGTLRKSGGAGTSAWFSVAVNNAGIVQAQSGTLQFDNSFTQNAGATWLNGGNLAKSGSLVFNGGALGGTGTITGNVANTGGIVSPGMSPGILRIAGNYTQGPTGTLNIELGGATYGAQYDVLDVTGAASLSGTLNVSLINGFTPVTGTVFQVMNYGSYSGGFSAFNGLSQGGGLVLMPYFSADNLSLLTMQGDVAAYKFAFPPHWEITPSSGSGNPLGRLGQRYLLRYYYNSPTPNPPDFTVAITDTLPAELTFESETHTPAMYWQQQGNRLTWQTASPVHQGQTGLIQVDTFSSLPMAGQTITNQAELGAGPLHYDMQAANQVPLFPPIITWPGNGEIYSGTLDLVGAAQPGVTVTLYANGDLVAQTLADPNGVFTATYLYPGTGAVTLTAQACVAGPLCSDDSTPVMLTPPQSFWCPQRSVWSGTPTAGPKAGQSLAFRFRDHSGLFATRNWMIPGVYGFWHTTLTLHVGNYPGKSTPPDLVWVIADGLRYDAATVAWPWYTFLIGLAHSVEVCAQSGSDSTCGSGNVLIDPDGYVFDVTQGLSVTASTVDTATGQIIPTSVTNTLMGITVTAMVSMPQWGGWVPWPAHLYDNQVNPQVTGQNGYFAFFTPPGDYYLQVDGIAGYQSWRSPVVHVISEIVHVNVPLTPLSLGAPTYAVTLTQAGPSPAVITVPLRSAVEWTAELSGSLPMEELADLMSNPVLRPLSARDPLSDTLGWDGGMMSPAQIHRRQFIQAGMYDYTDGMGHAGQVVVPRVDQAITFNSLPDKTFGDPPFALAASASSGLPVTFTTSISSTCSVSGTTVTLIEAGSCAITAHQMGDVNTNPAAEVTRTFTIDKANQTINFEPIADRTWGDPPFVITSTASSGLSVTFTASGICTVAGNLVTLTDSGRCTLTAHQAGNANYNAAPDVTQSFMVWHKVYLPLVLK